MSSNNYFLILFTSFYKYYLHYQHYFLAYNNLLFTFNNLLLNYLYFSYLIVNSFVLFCIYYVNYLILDENEKLIVFYYFICIDLCYKSYLNIYISYFNYLYYC